jgi:hypothetical protein
MDPRVPVMPPREFVRDYSIVFGGVKGVEQLALILNEVAKHAALSIVLRALARGRIRRDDIGEKWYSLCRDLLKVWIHEVSMEIIKQFTRELCAR